MAIGCVRVEPHGGTALYSSEEIASVAALAKRRAKQVASGFVMVDLDENAALLRRRTDVPHAALD